MPPPTMITLASRGSAGEGEAMSIAFSKPFSGQCGGLFKLTPSTRLYREDSNTLHRRARSSREREQQVVVGSCPVRGFFCDACVYE
jgi:hypothetical protein